jgi:hypothetical protein
MFSGINNFDAGAKNRAGGFEFGQRCREERLHSAEKFNQPPRLAGAQAGSDRQGKPLQGASFVFN